MKYTDIAENAPTCMGCRKANDGTLVLAHRNLNGWGMLFGKAKKGITVAGAILCLECHIYGDGDGRRDNHWWEMAVQRTLTWAVLQGYLRFLRNGGEPDRKLL